MARISLLTDPTLAGNPMYHYPYDIHWKRFRNYTLHTAFVDGFRGENPLRLLPAAFAVMAGGGKPLFFRIAYP
jgi:hypothetical protein